MPHSFSFHTDDPLIAKKIHDLIAGGSAASAPTASIVPPAAPVAPVANPAPPVAVAAPAAPVAPPTPAAPPAAVAPPAPAAPPTPAAPPAAPAAAPALDAQDQAVLAAGWSLEHVKQAATEFTQRKGPGGPATMKAVLGEFGAERIANGKNNLAPKHYPAFVEKLKAA